MIPSLSRRRFLAISACAIAMPTAARPAPARWQGVALGAGATMRLEGLSAAEAGPTFAAVEAEIARLEGIFSLFRPGSALSRLNAAGSLTAPPPDLLSVLALADRLHMASQGAFDPTIQPLWLAHAMRATEGKPVSDAELAALRERSGWDGLRFDAQAVTFQRPDMAITLNGVAQGYITDRVRALLLDRGLTDILIDMGEVAANGTRGDGAAWVAGVSDTEGTILRRVTLRDRALATSAPAGTVLDAAGRVGHILDPRSGRPNARHAVVSVSAESAAVADGLSTAGCLLAGDDLRAAIAAFPSARLEIAA